MPAKLATCSAELFERVAGLVSNSNPLLTLVRRNAVLLLHVSRQNAMILVGCLVLGSAREGPPGLPPTTGRGAAAGPRWT